ncbi:ECF transporter S component [Sporosarcina pasteurii]|uniref:Predicted membrane protein n=1 Tax=Sporosarcina pasteurii TaxID=1474 RepID=A0A380BCC4_SPOPA|nr:ECF transporter S component [Sporosarcina pasteurii]MDS9472308.1 ECF transporter S component [Sporosarcina pasteurii]QBQ06288.1 ECF transporter S component [Sporosarcina pasteurii]SUI99070.1 Predicted membrane protein [Sporosarcina pasteurii]
MRLKQLTLAAMFAALCAIGGLLKIPLGIGSTALDSTPALVASAFLPPIYAGMTALIGHSASALYAGFPLGPFHLLIALEMLAIIYVFARLHQAKYQVSKWVFFIVANGLLAPLPFYFLISPSFYVGIVPGILIATIFNAVIAAVVLPVVQNVWRERLGVLR